MCVNISVTVMVPILKVLHGCHLSHRCRCNHREDPCCDVDVGQTLPIGQHKASYHRFWSAYSSTTVELTNTCCAARQSVSVEVSMWEQSSYMNIVSHVAMRTQVRPRTEREEKFRYDSQLNRSNWLSLRHSTYIQLLLLSKPEHVGLIMLITKVVCNLIFVRSEVLATPPS